MPERYAELTRSQRAFVETLDDETIRSLRVAADMVGSLDADAISFLRTGRKSSFDFLRNADAETLKWLERASPEDIGQLQYSIKFMGASKILGRALWISLAAFAGMAITVVTLWDRFFAKVTK